MPENCSTDMGQARGMMNRFALAFASRLLIGLSLLRRPSGRRYGEWPIRHFYSKGKRNENGKERIKGNAHPAARPQSAGDIPEWGAARPVHALQETAPTGSEGSGAGPARLQRAGMG